MEKEIDYKDVTSECIFQGMKKQDNSYKVSFVRYDNSNSEVMESKESVSLSYQAVCSVTFEITGEGSVSYMEKIMTETTTIPLQNNHRFFRIATDESGMWRIDEAQLMKNAKGAKISKRQDQRTLFDISTITEDIVVPIVFIEKLEKPELQENVLSAEKETPTKLSEPKIVYLKTDEDVCYRYTVDGSDPKTSNTVQKYTKDGILLDSYEEVASIAVYAQEAGKDDSDVSTWYAQIIPNEPSVSNKDTAFSEGMCISDSNYIKTTDGKGEFIVNHAKDEKDNYQLELGLMLNKEEKKPEKVRYEKGRHFYTLPSALTTGEYEFELYYKTKGGHISPKKTIKSSVKIDNDKPTILVDSSMLLGEDNKAAIENGAWVSEDVLFELSGTAYSQIRRYEYSANGTDFVPLANRENKVRIPIAEIEESGSSFTFKSVSMVNTESDITQEFVVKKDITPPPVVEKENLLIETLTDSTEDVGNVIYSKENVKVTLKDVPKKEAITDSKITTKYRLDKIEERGSITKGTEAICQSDSIFINEMGKYRLCIWNVDEAGNASEEYKQFICYDNQDPIICSDPKFELKGDRKESGFADYRYFTKNSLTMCFTVKDIHAGLSRIVIKNGEQVLKETKLDADTKEASFEIGVSEEGKYRLSAFVYDKAGRELAIASTVDGFIIDRSGPEIQINSSKAEEEWQKEDISYSITANDNGSGIEKAIITMNGKPIEQAVNSYQESLQLQAAANEEAENSEGYLLQVEAFNNAGETQKMERRVYLDKTAPVITLGGIESSSVNQTAPNLSVSVVEKIYNLAEVTMTASKTIDGGTFSYNMGAYACSGVETTNQFAFSEDGIYEVLVEAKDKAGNQAEKQTINFTVDTTAPEIELSGANEGGSYTEDVSVQITVTESFYDTNEVTIKATKTIEGANTPYDMGSFPKNGKVSSMTHRFSEDGTYHLEVSARDKAGNVSDTKELSFTVDKTAPEVEISGIENYHVTDQAAVVMVSVTEAFFTGCKVDVSVKKENVEGKTAAFSVAPFRSAGKVSHMNYQFKQEGIYTIVVTATDEAGNTAEAEKILTIDTSYPIINHMAEFDGKYLPYFQLPYSQEEMIQDFTIADYTMTLNGDLYDGVSKVTEEGKYVFAIEVTDEVNHKSEAKAEFIIDNTAPEIIFIGAEDGQKSYEPIEFSVSLGESEDILTKVSINGQTQKLSEDGKTFEAILAQMDTYQIAVESEDLAKNHSVKNISVRYMEKPMIVKWYENKPVFYGSIAAGGFAIGGAGLAFLTGGFGAFAGGSGVGGAISGAGAAGKEILKKILFKLIGK